MAQGWPWSGLTASSWKQSNLVKAQAGHHIRLMFDWQRVYIYLLTKDIMYRVKYTLFAAWLTFYNDCLYSQISENLN